MSKEFKIVQVIVNNNSYQTDKLFDYEIPTHLYNKITRGMRVMVPFGRGNQRLEAYVFNVTTSSAKDMKLKKVLAVIDEQPILSEHQLRLAFWMRNQYLCKYIEAIHCLIPKGMINKERKLIILVNNQWDTLISPSQRKLKNILTTINDLGGKVYLDLLMQHIDYKEINDAIKTLLEKNIIDIKYEFNSKINIKTERYVYINVKDNRWNEALASLKNARKQKVSLEILKQQGECSVKELLYMANTGMTTLNSLKDKGYIGFMDVEVKRDPFANKSFSAFPKPVPNKEQQMAIDRIGNSIKNNINDRCLIHGITGSGKTEIYLQLIEKVIEKGKQGIVLVPEISLTPQTVSRFMGRFGDRIAVLHSSLSDGERYDEWRRIAMNEVDIVIGARSAIFAPLKNLGIIIIDEEHEHTYKSDQTPRYMATDIAEYRSQLENTVLVLGSATPSIETYHKALNGNLNLITLTKRATDAKLPHIEVVNMTKELELGNTAVFSSQLIAEMEENLKNQKQTILFLNRRGHSSVISCKSCGYVLKCEHCDITMTFHRTDERLKCHYCGQMKHVPAVCPSCNSDSIKYSGTGTQKIEDLVKHYLPTARIMRMDMDTTSRKGSHEKILESFKNQEIDILIGTQMISKGLDFPNVTLVGIISADSALNLPDFRAAERTFQLVTQVAGRAGRGLEEGRVILQTYEPNHYSIIASRNHDYEKFFQDELIIRKEFYYPPFTNLILLNFSGKDEKTVDYAANSVANHIKYILNSQGYNTFDYNILGPNPSMISKIKENYRYQILLKDVDVPFGLLKKAVKYLLIDNRNKYIPQNLTCSIDINPFTII
ncbi:primosomal protein N' [Alkaliphilus sp. B6464]|uniref:primosomal protein N' n=1 Tax=Alkaliphilus sp. B6464 TaxID=2731219 RepID=UPI001BAA03E1|nr:primosomal protein N' [Alkaliphilus sp. B6464]QUH20893.1 primosomal protein N' [Alkaliphilus sp. B6464]